MEARLAEDVVWQLKTLYGSEEDPRIEADRLWCREEADAFSKRYRTHVAELTPEELLEAVQRFERFHERAARLNSYAYLNFATQTQVSAASGLWQAAQEFQSALHRDTLFFELEWTLLEDERAGSLSAHPTLASYRHYLESIRRYRPYLLSESEEKLLAEKEVTCSASWCTLFDKVLSHQTFGERKRTEPEVLSELYHSDRNVRKAAAADLSQGLREILHILTHIFNSILLDKAVNDRLRGYPHWLKERNLGNEADDAMVDSLVSAASSRYDLVRRYYGLKRKLLGYEKLYDYDRYAPIPAQSQTTIPWEEAKRTVLDAYARFSPEMAGIARRFFDDAWIHAPILPGKRSGAFAHPTVPGHHPYVLVNYAGNPRDVMTLAHELGHGIHQFLSNRQGYLNSRTPLTTAETASVFGEMLVFHHLLETLQDPRERLALLCSKLEDIFATVFRQIAMNRFEEGIHTRRRASGELDAEGFSDLWVETQGAMFGDSVELLDHYRIWWSYIPHFLHVPGYVYAYAFGELLVLALHQQYREAGQSFVPRYLELLASGGSKAPAELLRPLGVDLVDPHFWELGLNALENLVQQAEELVK
jgi:oligoendopeptidase F